MISFVLLFGCRPGTGLLLGLEPRVEESEWVPSAFRVSWDGPAGTATLWTIDPKHASSGEVRIAPDASGSGWRRASSAEVAEGPSSLPLALLAEDRTHQFRLEVETGGGTVWSEAREIEVPAAPEAIGRPELDRVEPDRSEADAGWIVAHRYATVPSPETAYAVILDGRGEIVWWLPPVSTGQRVIRARPGRDGRSILVLQDHDDGRDFVERIRLDGSERTETDTPDASHDFVENADGTITWVGYDYSDVPLIPDVPWRVASDLLRTVPEGATDPDAIVDGFGFLDDYPVAPSLSCSHSLPNKFVAGAVDWTHVNSLIRSPDDRGWIVMARHFDALVHVGDDRSLIWQAGGIDGTLDLGPGATFEHSHTSHAWAEDDGVHVLVFDNGDHTPAPIVSRVVEVRIDAEAGTVDRVWDLPDPEGRFTSFLGDARRLPGGNTLVTWTAQKEVAEYTPEGDEVWKLVSDQKFGRSIWVPELAP